MDAGHRPPGTDRIRQQGGRQRRRSTACLGPVAGRNPTAHGGQAGAGRTAWYDRRGSLIACLNELESADRRHYRANVIYWAADLVRQAADLAAEYLIEESN